ncbi:AbrB/MazE/SpoVT family DNA-binding domain-containing protein [Candidatus Woesearchaeota archaeon]|nr:AbrB/MazE/SpoVT family DNA-binding domain-containing protein [Candidatus Woesearchaeota archaeon]MBT4321826.1 AbrB/MazE/SpoVT family DNA-binding domain-containing protein [Candidatus Woesearchaeota archaeon]
MKTIKVSEKGQIAIPLDIREIAGINQGDELIVMESNGKILLEKTQKISKKMEDDFKDLLKLSEISLKKFWSSKEDDIWDTI